MGSKWQPQLKLFHVQLAIVRVGCYGKLKAVAHEFYSQTQQCDHLPIVDTPMHE